MVTDADVTAFRGGFEEVAATLDVASNDAGATGDELDSLLVRLETVVRSLEAVAVTLETDGAGLAEHAETENERTAARQMTDCAARVHEVAGTILPPDDARKTLAERVTTMAGDLRSTIRILATVCETFESRALAEPERVASQPATVRTPTPPVARPTLSQERHNVG